MLMSMGQSEAALTDPLSDFEVMERMIRLMRGAGVRITRMSYIKAFPNREPVENTIKVFGAEMVDVPREKWPKSLSQLYRMCPPLKRTGVPQGYPVGKSKFKQLEWVQKEFVRYMVERRQADQTAALVSLEQATTGNVEPRPTAQPDRSEPNHPAG